MRRAPERSSGEDQISAPKNRVWRRYTPHKTSENGGRPHRTSPSRLAPKGPNFQIHVYEPLIEPHGDLWAQGATFGRVGPLRRQLLLLLHPCLAYLSQPLECSDGPENGRSARRPTGQQGGRISASEDHVWRRYTPHKTREKHPENGGRRWGPHRADLH